MIDAQAISEIFGALLGCWALGYGVGKAVAWTRQIVNVV